MNELEFDSVRHAYTYKGLPVPNVTQVLSPLNDFASIQEGVLEAAARRGREVHKATEALDRNWKPAAEKIWMPQDENFAYIQAWNQFKHDTKLELHGIEDIVFSQRYRYAGRIDRTGVLNGKRCILDIKTSVAISPVVGLQLAAYQQALNEQKRREVGSTYTKRFACQLRSDGTYRLQEFKDPADWTVFLALLTLHNWRTKYGVREARPWLPQNRLRP